MAKDGGPAFPQNRDNYSGADVGMSLRDYFAAASLTGTRPGRGFTQAEILLIARDCYVMADAMLAERDEQQKGT